MTNQKKIQPQPVATEHLQNQKGSLPQRPFGPRLHTTVIGFGGGALSGSEGGYGFGNVTQAQAQETLEKSFELGIRLFDTAPIYGFGESERRLGAFFKSHPSLLKECTVVTKLGVDWDSNRSVKVDNSPETTRRMLGQSLDRLGMSKVDVYMIHWPDSKTSLHKTMETLALLQEEGLFTSIGASNFTPAMIEEANQIAPIDVVQSPYCLVGASAGQELIPFCEKSSIGFMSYGTLAKGILAGTVREGRSYDPTDVRARGDRTHKQYLAIKDELEEFLSIAQTLGVTPAALAVAWVLREASVSTALCGSKNRDQVAEVAAGARLQLSPDIIARLNKISQTATPKFDGMS